MFIFYLPSFPEGIRVNASVMYYAWQPSDPMLKLQPHCTKKKLNKQKSYTVFFLKKEQTYFEIRHFHKATIHQDKKIIYLF